MTNYNERLDEILKTSHHRIRTRILRDAEIYQSHIAQSEYEAKQAITSLTKELVAEAKPEKHIHHDAYGKPFEDAQDIAYNTAIDQLEQNLLKALETL